jgi:hypothetical protein
MSTMVAGFILGWEGDESNSSERGENQLLVRPKVTMRLAASAIPNRRESSSASSKQ